MPVVVVENIELKFGMSESRNKNIKRQVSEQVRAIYSTIFF